MSKLLRKQVYDLTSDDLARHPVWAFAPDEERLDGQDEATVKPVMLNSDLDPRHEMYVITAQFRLADGTEAVGYMTPPADSSERQDMGCVQPVIVTADAQVAFWRGIVEPDARAIAECYLQLGGKLASEVFPLAFQSTVKLTGGPLEGILPGFSCTR